MSNACVRCPKCSTETDVVDTRAAPNNSTRRRRQCQKRKCQTRFTTYEVLAGSDTNSADLLQVLIEASGKLESATRMVLKSMKGQ